MPAVRDHVKDGVLTRSAPAGIARGCKLPKAKPDANGDVPYVIASKNPDGAFSVATLGRTKGREYRIPRCEVAVDTADADMIGVFGEYGFFGGTFINNRAYENLNKKLKEIGEKYGITDTSVAILWILRHAARMQPIIVTVNTGRIKEICKGADFDMTRQEWYELYKSTGKTLP